MSALKHGSVPAVLLIGVGRFGRHHLRILKEFSDEGQIRLAGVVVRDPLTRKAVAAEFGVSTYASATPALLRSVDAVSVVTPPETHYALVKRCLAYTNVFVEKPLAMNERDSLRLIAAAKEHNRLLMVGHVFRFHPVAQGLRTRLADRPLPLRIEGSFLNPLSTDQGREPSLELLHLFDVVDMLWERVPRPVFARTHERTTIVDARYGSRCDARFMLGWKGDSKARSLSFIYDDELIEADFLEGTVTSTTRGISTTESFTMDEEPLRLELESFVRSLQGKERFPVNGKVGARVVAVAEQAGRVRNAPLSVAVIGGGLFGANIAAEFASVAKVTLFEKGPSLMSEGSYVNQMRHHMGYHYPRSDETAQEVQESKADFERHYEGAILRDNPTYYAIAREGSLVSPAEFRAFCKRHGLPYKPKGLPDALLAREKIDTCLEVVEPSYDLAKLKELVQGRLASVSVRIRKNTCVTSVLLTEDGRKQVSYSDARGSHSAEFDIVVNATYADINQFARGLGFATVPVRVDIAEILIVALPIDPISITIVDGPFATLMPTSVPNEFALYHARESVIERYVPEDGLARQIKGTVTNAEKLLAACTELFPVLKDAVIVESRVINRGVMANHEHDDRRTADIIDHGFGVYSVLSGKISSSVSAAIKIRDMALPSANAPRQEKS